MIAQVSQEGKTALTLAPSSFSREKKKTDPRLGWGLQNQSFSGCE